MRSGHRAAPVHLGRDGERVSGWEPEYLSGATDEVGAVWRTSDEQDLTWTTTDREDARVRYARISGNGTAGLVEVLCARTDEGTGVQVTYDLTASTPPASTPPAIRDPTSTTCSNSGDPPRPQACQGRQPRGEAEGHRGGDQ